MVKATMMTASKNSATQHPDPDSDHKANHQGNAVQARMRQTERKAHSLGHDIVWSDVGDGVYYARCQHCHKLTIIYSSGTVFGYNTLSYERCQSNPQPSSTDQDE